MTCREIAEFIYTQSNSVTFDQNNFLLFFLKRQHDASEENLNYTVRPRKNRTLKQWNAASKFWGV